MAAPFLSPDYNPNTWKLGYLIAQYGTMADPAASGTGVPAFPPSIYSSLANPPAAMTTAIELALPTAPAITPTQ